MKRYSTNYYNTFIEVAEDCPVEQGEVPPRRGSDPSIANLQFDMLQEQPYRYTSDELLFTIYATRKDLPQSDWKSEQEKYFSKGQPCLRTSPLAKRYGWGIHSNGEGRLAIYPIESVEYQNFLLDDNINHKKAMKSSRGK